LGNGDGTFQPATSIALEAAPVAVAVGDFNRDGRQDVAAVLNVLPSGTGGVAILLGNGDGTFEQGQILEVGMFPRGIAVGDLRGNGRQDLVVPSLNSGAVSVLLGNGDGTFEPARTVSSGLANAEPIDVAFADVNGDGQQDLVLADSYSNDVSILLGNGDGTFQPGRLYGTGFTPAGVAVGDFNGDGRPDVATADAGSNGVSILINGWRVKR
jgi:hypothetical protein